MSDNKSTPAVALFSARSLLDRIAVVSAPCLIGLSVLVLANALSANAQAQSTVIIGGSGKSNVEVNLDALEPSRNTTSYGRVLKMPGMTSMKDSGPITLRMPRSMQNSMSSGGSSTKTSVQRLVLKRPANAARSVAKRAPALPAARITTSPAPKITRVTPPPQKAVPKAMSAPVSDPVVIAAKPKPAPMPPAIPASAPKAPSKPVQIVTKTPAAPVMPAPVVRKTKPKEQKVSTLVQKMAKAPPGMALRVGFNGNSTRISASEKNRLNTLANKMAGGSNRLQLKSYSGSAGETASASRRRSLSRALSVRSHLIEKGIRSTRIDVRALGAVEDAGPSDRVDIVVLAN